MGIIVKVYIYLIFFLSFLNSQTYQKRENKSPFISIPFVYELSHSIKIGGTHHLSHVTRFACALCWYYEIIINGVTAFIFSLCIFISKERNMLDWLVLYIYADGITIYFSLWKYVRFSWIVILIIQITLFFWLVLEISICYLWIYHYV